MRRKLLITIGIAVLVALAGCNTFTGGTSTEASPTTSTATVEQTEEASNNGLTTADFDQSRASLLEEDSLTIERSTEASASGTFEDKNYTRQQVEDAFTSSLTAEMNLAEDRYYIVNTVPQGSQTLVTTGDETFVRLEGEQQSSPRYQYGTAPYENSSVRPANASDIIEGTFSPTPLIENLTISESGETELDGETVTVYSVDSDAFTAALNEDAGDGSVTFDSATLRYYVNEDGQVVAYERATTLAIADTDITVDVRQTARVVSVGETTFDDPEWLDDARNS